MKRSAMLALATTMLLSNSAFAAGSATPAPTNGKALYKEGKYTEALRAFEAVISEKRNAEIKEQRQYAELLLDYGRALAAVRKYDEALKMLKQAAAIGDAFVLPSELTQQIKVEIENVAPNARQIPGQNNYSGGYSSYRDPSHRDAGEEEFLEKAGIDYAKERFGAGSMTYLQRHLDYAKFLSQQQRHDDLAKQATICREIFAKMTPSNQSQMAPHMVEFAMQLVQSRLPIDADTIGSAVLSGIVNGEMKNETKVAEDLERLASNFENSGNSELAQKYYAASVRAFEKEQPADDPRLAARRTALAGFYHKVGKNAAAIELLEMSVASQTKNISSGSPEALTALANLCELYCLANNIPKAKECTERIVEALAHTSTEGQMPYKAMFETAKYLAAKDEIATAEKLYKAEFAALRRARRQYSDWELARDTKELATTFAQQGHPEQAEKIMDAFIESRSTALGKPTAASIVANLEKAQFFMEQESFDKAAAAALNAVQIAKQYPNNGDARIHDFARQFMEHKQYDTALQLEQGYIEAAQDNPHYSSDWQLAEAKARIAKMQHIKGNEAEAKRVLDEMLQTTWAKQGSRFDNAKPVLQQAIDKLVADKDYDGATELASAIAQANSYQQPYDALMRMSYPMRQHKLWEETQKLLQLCLDMQTASRGPSSAEAANVMRELGQLYRQQGDETKAQELTRAADSVYALIEKQNRSEDPDGHDIYDPKAPISDTVKAAALPLNSNTPNRIIIRRVR